MLTYPKSFSYVAAGRSVEFEQVLSLGHSIRSYGRIEDGVGNALTDNFGIESGTVTIDQTAVHRRSVNGMKLTPYGNSGLTDQSASALLNTLIPASSFDVAAPFGNRLRIWRGFKVRVPDYYGNLADSWFDFPLGLLRISNTQTSDDGYPTLTVSASDLSRAISRNRFTQPYIVAAGSPFRDAITNLVQDRLPGTRVQVDTNDEIMPLIVIEAESNPWAEATKMAQAVGMEVYFDPTGICVVRYPPDTSKTAPSWTYTDENSQTMLSVGKSLSDEPGYNGVVLTAESTTLPAPLRAEVWDDDPNSATYRFGRYGQVPAFVSNPYASTQLQATAAAKVEYNRISGASEQTTLTAVPNPAHEAGDVIRVYRKLSRINQICTIDSLDIPLGADQAMSITTKTQKAVL